MPGPKSIPFWRIVTVCFFAYSALSWAYLLLGPRRALLRWSVAAASVAAAAAGAFAIVEMIGVANNGGHFEGYMILMGLILCGHAASALAYTVLSRRIARRVSG